MRFDNVKAVILFDFHAARVLPGFDTNVKMRVFQTFKDRLIDELNYHGISNRDFAAKVGISPNTLNMYLYRGSLPAVDVAVRMAQVLNTTAEYLVTGVHSNEKLPKSDTKLQWQKNEINIIADSLTPSKLEHFLEIARAYKTAVDE